MKRIATLVTIVLLVTALQSTPVHSQSGIPPSDDTWADFHNPGVNNNNEILLTDYSQFPSCVITSRIFLRFQLNSLIRDVDDSTALRVYVSEGPVLSALSLALWSTGDDWNGSDPDLGDETTLTWNNAPNAPNHPGIHKLAVQSVTQSASDIWVEFSSSALATYLNTERATADQMASFVIEVEFCPAGVLLDTVRLEDRDNSNGGDAFAPEILPQYPTAVELVSFEATPGPGHLVTLDWETSTELNALGFNLYRSETVTGTQELLNDSLIPSKSMGMAVGAVYQIIDRSTAPATTYYYWLEAVHSIGPDAVYGPKSATTGNYRSFLPWIFR